MTDNQVTDRNSADEPDGTPAHAASMRPPGETVTGGPDGGVDFGADDDPDAAANDAEVRRALGTPIDTKLPRQSSVNSNNGRTHARFTIPLDGPQADGVLHVDAQKEGEGEWEYRTLAVELEDGTRIDLRDDAAPPRGPEEPDVGSEEQDLPPSTPKPPVPPEPPFGAEPPGRGTEEEPPREGDSDIEL